MGRIGEPIAPGIIIPAEEPVIMPATPAPIQEPVREPVHVPTEEPVPVGRTRTQWAHDFIGWRDRERKVFDQCSR